MAFPHTLLPSLFSLSNPVTTHSQQGIFTLTLTQHTSTITMGFASFYYGVILPKPLVVFIQLLDSIQQCVFLSLLQLGLLPDPLIQDPIHHHQDPIASAIKDRLQVVSFSSLDQEPSVCAVCLGEMEAMDTVRELGNCSHLFHKGCIDKWVELGQITCPLCRSLLLPKHHLCHFM
ncbi:hypothetical protein LUZ60_007382 [Juncus effusus]|nr:hypothetical protein LUZ60_007382 [Juncus effusus]